MKKERRNLPGVLGPTSECIFQENPDHLRIRFDKNINRTKINLYYLGALL